MMYGRHSQSPTVRAGIICAWAVCVGLVNVTFGADTTPSVNKHRAPGTEDEKASMDRPLFGVIRWDFFYGGDNKTNPELRSLSPKKYHNRVPFFLKIESENKVSGNENDQEIIDRQIEYAKSSGIDYWAFTIGPEMNANGVEYYALAKLLKSKRKADIQFCVILHKYNNSWQSRVKALTALFKDPAYVKVLGDRPLVYIFNVLEMEKQYGNDTKNNLDLLMRETIAAGLGRPYVAFMATSASAGAAKVRQYGVDALSAYANLAKDARDATYASLAASDVSQWKKFRNTGVKVVPLVSLGWNENPRVDNPPSWGNGGFRHFDLPTADEIAVHIRQGFEFVQSHPDACDAQSILCYAWNEYNEGGWLCPTYGEGTKRLDAIGMMIKTYSKGPKRDTGAGKVSE